MVYAWTHSVFARAIRYGAPARHDSRVERQRTETMKSTEVLGRAATASEPFDESSFRASTAVGGGGARQRRTAIRTGSCVTRRANRTRGRPPATAGRAAPAERHRHRHRQHVPLRRAAMRAANSLSCRVRFAARSAHGVRGARGPGSGGARLYDIHVDTPCARVGAASGRSRFGAGCYKPVLRVGRRRAARLARRGGGGASRGLGGRMERGL